MAHSLTWILLLFFVPGYRAVPLLLSVTRRIRMFEDWDSRNDTSITPAIQQVVAVDYHLARNELYFTEATGQIYRTRLRADKSTGDPTVIAEVKLSDGIAVDWIHNNLYWTDVQRKTVEVATLDGLHRTVLFNASNGVDKPRAIVLDPSRGLLFWSDWGDNARIESSGLDGKNNQAIVSSNLFWPNGLTLDLSNLKIYILDGFLSTISSCNYDGSEFKILVRSQDDFLQAFGISFYSNTLYLDSWRSRTLFKMNIDNMQKESILQQKGLLGIAERMMGLKVVHASLQQQPSTPDPCKAAACSHWCLISRDLTPSCFCPFGFKLSDDRKTCLEEGYLLVSWRRSIRRYNMAGTEDESLIDTTKAAIAIGYHLKKGLVFWSDIEEHRIYRAPLDQLNNKTVIATPETCDGLAVDWIHDVLYWTDLDRNTLEAAQLDGSKHMVIFDKDLDKPRDVAVDPLSGLMFWTDWGTTPKIERSTLDGLERTVIVEKGHVWPNGLTIDIETKKIYWVDGKLGTISSCSYDGSNKKLIFARLTLDLQLFSITHLKDELFWTDWQTRTLYRSPKDEIETAQSIATSSIIFLRPHGVKAVHSSLQKTADNPCAAVHCNNLCLGTTYHGAHCMGEEIADTDVRSGSDSVHTELVTTAYNDSIAIYLPKNYTPTTVVITVKCLSRNGCEGDPRCTNQSRKTSVFNDKNSFNITGLLPATRYEVEFLSAKLDKSFNITTKVTEPSEVPTITSVEKQGRRVTVKWDPVDTCIPDFSSYHYKLFKTEVENDVPQEGSTNSTEVVFDNLEAEVSYTIRLYTNNPDHFSSMSFDVHKDIPLVCHNQNLLCNGQQDCPDGSDEDVKLCAGVETVTVYKKSKSEVFFRVEVTNATKKQLDKLVGSYSNGNLNTTEQFEKAAEPCIMWPYAYCFHASFLQQNTVYDFKISAALRDGRVGNKFIVSVITKEEASEPPEDVRVYKHNATYLEFQWHHPNKSNGIIKSFVINIDETETFEEEKCCQSFPIIELPVSAEQPFYEIGTSELTPASTYAVSIAAKNMYVGSSAVIVVNTPPPPMEIIRLPKVDVASLLPLSWRPGNEPVTSPLYHKLIRQYVLLLLPPKNEPFVDTGINDLGPIKELLQSKLGDRLVVLWKQNVEETAAFLSPIKVEAIASRKPYKLVWVQVSQYKDSYSIDFMESDTFIAV